MLLPAGSMPGGQGAGQSYPVWDGKGCHDPVPELG